MVRRVAERDAGGGRTPARDTVASARSPLVEAPFHCDYGAHRLGARVFVNISCIFLDAAPIVLGDDVQLGPAVQLHV